MEKVWVEVSVNNWVVERSGNVFETVESGRLVVDKVETRRVDDNVLGKFNVDEIVERTERCLKQSSQFERWSFKWFKFKKKPSPVVEVVKGAERKNRISVKALIFKFLNKALKSIQFSLKYLTRCYWCECRLICSCRNRSKCGRTLTCSDCCRRKSSTRQSDQWKIWILK